MYPLRDAVMSTTTSSLAWDTANSPFATVVGTNYAPSSAELTQLNEILIRPRKELDRLDSEIARVQATLDSLRLQKQSVETYIEAHRALGSIVRRIPPETLGEIFQWCLPLDTEYGVRSMEYAPLLLTTICREWRHIALSSPRLWSSLHIYFHPHLRDDVRSRRVAGVESWLRRSGGLPKAISLCGYSFGSHRPAFVRSRSKSPNTLVPLLKSLISFGDTLQHLSLSLNANDLLAFQELIPPSSSFTSLTTFKFEDLGHSSISATKLGLEALPPFLSRMPALQTLEIKKLTGRGDVQFHTLHSRWNMLTNLSILPSLDPADLFSILAQTRALKTLAVGITVTAADFDASSLPPASLIDLVRLELTIEVNRPPNFFPFNLGREEVDKEQNLQVACISALLSRVTCPALRTLYLSWRSVLAPVTQAPIIDFPVRALDTLGLEIPMTPEAFMECLSLVPNLVSLDFVDAGNVFQSQGTTTLQDVHLTALTPSADNPVSLCPHLRHFRMMDHSSCSSDLRSWSTHALARFIIARAKANILDYCDLYFVSSLSLSDEEMRDLRAVKEDGKMKLRIYGSRALPPPPPPPPPQVREVYEDEPMSGLVCQNQNQTGGAALHRRLSDILETCAGLDVDMII
ncbi:hypothetical protein D9757_007482 [Collybiopsis confluens]|uniref:F-box domain-containing protein n=1 Tax=Collybiopsis confluens TaxID=2823264 RepID=A0A8H5HJU3_9AGAR|nr:hypothetical protein D9757_007482 [Collybiopsis confluens]